MIRAALALWLAADPALADTAPARPCFMDHAIYADRDGQITVTFRPASAGEQTALVKHVFEAKLAGGQDLWGVIAENRGVSRDEGQMFYGCARPGGKGPAPDPAQVSACRVWQGVVYALSEGAADFTPMPGDPAPPSLIFSDLGRQLVAAMPQTASQEPWDQLALAGCTE